MPGNESTDKQPPLFEVPPTTPKLTTPDGVTIDKPPTKEPQVSPSRSEPEKPSSPPPKPDPAESWKRWADR